MESKSRTRSRVSIAVSNRIVIFALVLCFCLISCSSSPTVELPNATFSNFELRETYKMKNHIDFLQVGNDSVQVSLNDSLTFKIDSNLHFHIFSNFSDEIDFMFPTIPIQTIQFDKNTPFSKIELIQDELKKLDLLNFTMLTNDSGGILIRIPPLLEGENPYRHPFVNEKLILPPKPPPAYKVFNLIKPENSLIISITESKIKILKQDQEVEDFVAEILKMEDHYLLYELNASNTYQDYITIVSLVFSSFEEARERAVMKGGLSKKKARKKYRIRMIKQPI